MNLYHAYRLFLVLYVHERLMPRKRKRGKHSDNQRAPLFRRYRQPGQHRRSKLWD